MGNRKIPLKIVPFQGSNSLNEKRDKKIRCNVTVTALMKGSKRRKTLTKSLFGDDFPFLKTNQFNHVSSIDVTV